MFFGGKPLCELSSVFSIVPGSLPPDRLVTAHFFNLKTSTDPFCSVMSNCLFKGPVQSPTTWTAGWAALEENEIMSVQMEPLVLEVKGQVNVLCSMKMEALEEWWSSLNVQLKYKGTIYAMHSALANPPLHKSAYKATEFLKPGEVQLTNNTGIRFHYYRANERVEMENTLPLLWQKISW